MRQIRRRSAVLLSAAVVLSGIIGPAAADDPPAQAARRADEPGQINPDRKTTGRPDAKPRDQAEDRSNYPGPKPSEIDAASIRGLNLDTLERLARIQKEGLDRALAQARDNRRQAEAETNRNTLIEKIPEALRPPDARRFFEWGGALFEGKPYTLGGYFELQSVYWTDVANRHGANMLVVQNAITAAIIGK